jgi:hypothetical protein
MDVCVLCVVQQRQKAKARTMKKKEQVWIKSKERKKEYKIPVEPRFSTPIQTGPGVYQASYAMRTGSLTRG